MNNPDMQFLKYTPVTGEKYLGIAVMRWLGKIILRFKVMESTQAGGGYWVTGGSVKLGVKADGKDNYEEWYQIDSSYDRDMLKEFVLMHVEPILRQSRGSIYGGQSSQPMQNPAYGQQTQQQAYNAPQQPPMPNYNNAPNPVDYGNPPF